MAKKAISAKALPGGRAIVTYDDNSTELMTVQQAQALGLKVSPPVAVSASQAAAGAGTVAGSYGQGATQGAFTDQTTGQSVAGAATIPTKNGPKTVAELVMQARNPKNLANIRTLLVNNGLLDKNTKSLTSVQNAWLQVLIGAQTSQLDPEDYIKKLRAGGFGVDTTGAAGGTTEYPSIYSSSQADAKITDVFNKVLGRAPTQQEIDSLKPQLIDAQKKNPAVQTVKKVGGKTVQSTTGGLDTEQWLTNKITSNPAYKTEIEQGALTSRDAAKRAADKAAYDKAINAAAGDKTKIDKINQTSNYGLALTGLKNSIKSVADAAGASYDDAQLETWAKEAYDTNQDVNSATLKNFLTSKFKFGTEGFKGAAADNFNALRDTALANGIDINKAFSSQLPGWLDALNKGANIEDFKNIIRGVAKIGMPEKVSKLMDQGIDLKTIYAPYQNLMENVLQLPRGSVTLDDPTLRAAVTSEGEVPLYQFERNLRQDNRWQYTDSARQEVSSAVTKVLKDFGFQG